MDMDAIRRELAAEKEPGVTDAELTEITQLMSQLYLAWDPPDEVIELLAPETREAPTARPGVGAASIARLQANAPDLGPLIESARKQSGLDPAEVERAFGVSTKELGWWEQGRGIVALLDHSPALIRRFTSRLGIEPGAFALGFATQLARQSVTVRRFTAEGTDTTGPRGRSMSAWIREYLEAGQHAESDPKERT